MGANCRRVKRLGRKGLLVGGGAPRQDHMLRERTLDPDRDRNAYTQLHIWHTLLVVLQTNALKHKTPSFTNIILYIKKEKALYQPQENDDESSAILFPCHYFVSVLFIWLLSDYNTFHSTTSYHGKWYDKKHDLHNFVCSMRTILFIHECSSGTTAGAFWPLITLIQQSVKEEKKSQSWKR